MPAEVSIRSARPPSTPPRPGNAGRPFRRSYAVAGDTGMPAPLPDLPPLMRADTRRLRFFPVLSAESRCWRVDGRPTVDQVAPIAPGS